ncbi:hypothetical protein FZ103_09955 [Streptomonospora sp. PA3]|uniref:hypothetical protein n=1 Tax=Streptomonospora sp. PA3 TaxID=2607326 RepID=UPI0012DC249E|nr:hypothetical protein [Streptomonospora sp. PA3]MUL41495.1 hypothetical protein [Streptomonospora sp. PA3]
MLDSTRTAAFVLCAAAGMAAAAGCGVVDTGVRVSGAAPTPATPAPQSGDATTTRTLDAVEVLRDDPGVSDAVKDAIARPCTEGYGAGWYPVYVRYHELPRAGVPVALVNVQGCDGEAACPARLAGYVFRLWEDRAERVYTTADGASRVAWYDGGPVVEHADWAADSDSQTCPRTVTRTLLEWDGTRLSEAADGGTAR